MNARNIGSTGDDAAQRWGLWALAAGGSLIAILTAFWMTGLGGGGNDPAQQARDQASLLSVIGFGWLQILAFVALIFGLLALYAGARPAAPRAALAGLVLGILSLSAVIAAFGAAALGGAVVAHSYLNGNTGALDAMNHLSGGSFGAAIMQALVAGTILSVLCAIAGGIALWREAAAPRWAIVAFGLGFVLAVASIPGISTVGGLLLIASGVVFTRSLLPRATVVSESQGGTQARPQPTHGD